MSDPRGDIELPMPHSPEAEQAVLGAILLDNSAFDAADDRLVGDEFFEEANDLIYQAMRHMQDEGIPIDLVTLTTLLQERKQLEQIGGVSYLSRLASSVVTTSNIAFYLDTVISRYNERQAINQAQQILAQAKRGGDTASVAASMAESAAVLADRAAKGKDFRPMREVVMDTYEGIEHRYAHRAEHAVTGIPSGFPDLDRMTSGFQRSDLIIVAARPSVGKTAFALNVAQNAGVRAGETVAIFSLEMSATQLVQRMLSAEQSIDASRIRTGFLEGDDWERLTMATGTLAEANIMIDDTPGITVSDIRAKCRRLKKSAIGLDLILIDYLQLVTVRGRRENRQQEVSEISRMLKQLARELDVPVIALSQLSRAVEQRQDKRPMMSDLRESGAIEQDADIVAFLYRDDYYDKESEKKNIIEIIISKHRNGPVGTVELVFLKNYSKFVSMDRGHQDVQLRPVVGGGRPIPDMWRQP